MLILTSLLWEGHLVKNGFICNLYSASKDISCIIISLISIISSRKDLLYVIGAILMDQSLALYSRSEFWCCRWKVCYVVFLSYKRMLLVFFYVMWLQWTNEILFDTNKWTPSVDSCHMTLRWWFLCHMTQMDQWDPVDTYNEPNWWIPVTWLCVGDFYVTWLKWTNEILLILKMNPIGGFLSHDLNWPMMFRW